MPTEINDTTHGAPVNHEAGSALSAHVFSNPREFIQILKDDFNKIDTDNDKNISGAELRWYASHGEDEKGRAAAKIAADHFPVLQLLNVHTLPEAGSGIRQSALNTELERMQVSPEQLSKESQKAFKTEAWVLGGAAVALAVATVPLAIAMPLELAALSAVLSIGSATGIGIFHQGRDQELDRVTTIAREQQVVKSWLDEPANGK